MFLNNYALDFSEWEKKNRGYALKLFRRYYSIFVSRFDWEGLPDGLLSRYIERVLFFHGQGILFKDKTKGFLFLPCTNNGALDAYFEPMEFYVIGNKINKKIDLKKNQGVWLRNDYLGIPTALEVMHYCERIADVERTIETRLMYHKIPLMFKTTDKKLLSTKNIVNQIAKNKPYIYLQDDSTADLKNSLIVDNTESEFIIDRLYDYRNELVAELNSLAGIDDTMTNKEGGISPDEINISGGATRDGYSAALIECRKLACEEAHEIFPELSALSCKLRSSREEPRNNGNVYDRAESLINIGNIDRV